MGLLFRSQEKTRFREKTLGTFASVRGVHRQYLDLTYFKHLPVATGKAMVSGLDGLLVKSQIQLPST